MNQLGAAGMPHRCHVSNAVGIQVHVQCVETPSRSPVVLVLVSQPAPAASHVSGLLGGWAGRHVHGHPGHPGHPGHGTQNTGASGYQTAVQFWPRWCLTRRSAMISRCMISLHRLPHVIAQYRRRTSDSISENSMATMEDDASKEKPIALPPEQPSSCGGSKFASAIKNESVM